MSPSDTEAADPCWSRAEGVNWRAIEGDEGVLLNLTTGDYYALNPLGLKVWQLIDGKHGASAIAGALAREFGEPEETVAKDVLSFGKVLAREGLLNC